MSNTLKAAILALKSRIADAYTAVSQKGGTLPATQDSANLPTAIASIPSGGSGLATTGFVPTPQGELADFLTSDFVNLTECTIYSYNLGLAVSLRCRVIFAPASDTQYANIISNTITEVYFLTLKHKANRLQFAAATVIKTDLLETVYGTEIIFNRCNSLREINLPVLVSITQAMLVANSGLVERINMPVITFCTGRICYGGDEGRIADIVVGAMTTNLNTNWRPYAYYSDAAKMAEINANIRNHIAANVADGGGVLTFSVRADFYAYLEQATLDAFAAKNWLVAGT